MTPWVLVIRAHGDPAPQGSKSQNRYGVMFEASKKLKPWREAVRLAGVREIVSRGMLGASIQGGAIKGAVEAELAFSLRRPLRAKGKDELPAVKPDIDKLSRAVLDALKMAGAYEDDARVVIMASRKVYVNSSDPDSLSSPGVIIRLRPA